MNSGLLKRLCETPGVSGYEEKIAALVADEMRPLVDTVRFDALGNVIGVKKGSGGPRLMIAAHVDEIGFFVKHVDDQGFLRLQQVGFWDARNLVSQRVLVQGFAGQTLRGALQLAAKPIHLLDPSEIKPLKLDDLFVDLGMSAEQVRASVGVGDMVTMDRTFEETATCVMSKALDDRVCVYVMLEALRIVGPTSAEIVAVASTQEEVGLRGARAAAFDVQPEIAIGLDVTLAVNIPGAPPESAVTRLGAGPAIKIIDSSMIANPKVVRHLRDIADALAIPHQLELLPFGGQDGGAMQLARGGAAAGTISVPTRYVHSPNEMASKDDIDGAIRLLARFMEEAGSRSYRFDGA
ncbi:MAG: M42 family metallopeptidase [Thermomicrobiales bacterium]